VEGEQGAGAHGGRETRPPNQHLLASLLHAPPRLQAARSPAPERKRRGPEQPPVRVPCAGQRRLRRAAAVALAAQVHLHAPRPVRGQGAHLRLVCDFEWRVLAEADS